MDELSDYDYELPDELIASQPPAERTSARLLVVDRERQSLSHHSIRDLPTLLRAGDRLVLNDTRVLPARLFGTRAATGGKWEGLYLDSDASGCWRLLSQSGGKLRAGEWVHVTPAHPRFGAQGESGTLPLELKLIEKQDGGVWLVEPNSPKSAVELLTEFGTMPLPPYIRRPLANDDDFRRYQTTYAKTPGAVAAPTAGLHFTPELLEECRSRGIEQSFVTLHVGIGTFRPIAVERLSDHHMHSEWCELSQDSAVAICQTRQTGGRIVAVGTTSVRTLESAARSGKIEPRTGDTDLFIRPPYEFRAVDVLLTNFHLPRSSLLVLVSAFAGRELIRHAYETAIAERYRFFSYGDAMLIL